MTRRRFLGLAGGAAAACMLPGCTRDHRDDDHAHVLPEGDRDRPQEGLHVPEAATVGRFLNPAQLVLVEAIVARLIPGDQDDPGAVEAGVVDYIDRLLATHEGYPQRTYVRGPFARAYEGEEPEPEDGVIWVEAEELPRYGWQSGYTPRQIYRMGLARLQDLTDARHGQPFEELSSDEQDTLLEALEDAEDEDVEEMFEPIGADTFFDLVHEHTIEGFLGDPLYGGNQGLVGWRLIGFPGAQRAYSPEEMLDPDFSRPPQSLAQLAMLHGDHRDEDALLSVRRRHPAGPID